MNQKTYKKLRDIIVKAVPEIMELKFGCEIQCKKWYRNGEIMIYLHPYYTGNDCYEILHVNKSHRLDNSAKDVYWIKEKEFKNDYKTLGRPITLEDVLVAIKIKLPMSGNDWINYHNVALILIKDKWQPNKSLKDQSDECGKFLLNILE